MARNPELYPTEYSPTCPGTQVDEFDPIQDLQAQILRLRNQHLLQVRQAGVGLAEVQNQTLQDESILYRSIAPSPPIRKVINVINVTNITEIINSSTIINAPIPPSIPTPEPRGQGECFLGGGEKHSVHGQVDKFSYAAERVSLLRWALTTPRMRHIGFASNARGYWCGGQQGFGKGNRVNLIEGIRFATEQKLTVGATLTANRVYGRGTASETKGYAIGNFDRSPDLFDGSIDGFTFSTGAIALLGASLANAVGGLNINNNESKAYCSSGWNGTRNINTLTFSNDTTASIAAQLSVVRIRAAAFDSDSKGYVAGGWSNPNYRDTIDAILFADDSLATIAEQLPVGVSDVEGAASNIRGYTFGGTDKALKLQGFRFDREQLVQVRAALSRGGRYPVPVGRQ